MLHALAQIMHRLFTAVPQSFGLPDHLTPDHLTTDRRYDNNPCESVAPAALRHAAFI